MQRPDLGPAVGEGLVRPGGIAGERRAPDAHALGDAGGAGGEDHVGGGFRCRCRRAPGRRRASRQVVDQQPGDRRLPVCAQPPFGDDQPEPGLLDDGVEARGRLRGIERNEGGAGLQSANQGRDQFGGTRHVDTDQGSRRDPLSCQAFGYGVRPGVEVAPRQRAGSVDQEGTVRFGRHMGPERLEHVNGRCRLGAGAGRRGGQLGRSLRRTGERHRLDLAVRRVEKSIEQVEEVLRKPLRPADLLKRGVDVEIEGQVSAAREIHDAQAQQVLGVAATGIEPLDPRNRVAERPETHRDVIQDGIEAGVALGRAGSRGGVAQQLEGFLYDLAVERPKGLALFDRGFEGQELHSKARGPFEFL